MCRDGEEGSLVPLSSLFQIIFVCQGCSRPQFPHLGNETSPLSPVCNLSQGRKGDKGSRGDWVSTGAEAVLWGEEG